MSLMSRPGASWRISQGLVDTYPSDMMNAAGGSKSWVAQKMVGKVSIGDVLRRRIVGVLETGPETSHPNFVELNGTTYGFVPVAALNLTKLDAVDIVNLKEGMKAEKTLKVG
ncbi:hypothetical protein CC78DRAFT_606024 [Lojkania enalia]|uniref:Uncharacterized protein n=1 Tax=Lojkania enalia TaxID=147567 RepID=A0A9P4K758_9PLEO|nr:hypothetical protein CC78DRAFT_606024 [Didymosphaeria enalia]